MHVRTWLATAVALLVTVGVAWPALNSNASSEQDAELIALGGEWLYVEDRTEDRPVEEQQPPMSVTFGLRIEENAFVMIRGKGTRRHEQVVPLDGSVVEVEKETSKSRYRAVWKDGALAYETEIVRLADDLRIALIRKEFRALPDGLEVRVGFDSASGQGAVAFYRHPEDIPLPTPAKAEIADLEWFADAWVGQLGSSSIEERWSPPSGGSMLGVSRTISGGTMVAFEYLRVVERDGGLVYVAQPGGSPPTEFVLTEIGDTRAVFENPRHDSPQRIVYELTEEGLLHASIGFINGGRPQVFQFSREGF